MKREKRITVSEIEREKGRKREKDQNNVKEQNNRKTRLLG